MKPDHHAWDHLPGGEDPIDFPALQFDKYPQDGDFLYVKTTDAGASPNGWAMEFLDDSGSGSGIHIRSLGWDVEIQAARQVAIKNATGSSLLGVGSGIDLTTDSGVAALSLTFDGKITMQSTDWTVDSSFGFLHMQTSEVRLASATGRQLALVGATDAELVAVAGSVSLEASGAAASALLMGVNAAGPLLTYNMIGLGGVYGGTPTAGHYFSLDTASGTVGSVFEIRDTSGLTPFFRIAMDAAGVVTFHLPTGATWATDL